MKFAVTERGTIKRCERKAVLTSKNGRHLTKIFPPLSLSLGTLMHRAHQLWITAPSDSPRTLRDWCMDAGVEQIDEARERYKKQVGCYPDENELSSLYEAIDFGLAMSVNYQTRWETPLPPDYRLIAAEQKIAVPVPGTEHTCETCYNEAGYNTCLVLDNRPDSPTRGAVLTCPDCVNGRAVHYLEGRLDGLIQHVPTGRLDILERKTYGERPREDVLRKNDQFLGYEYLVRRLDFNTDLGVQVAYDGMWRRKEPPRGRTFDDLFARYTLPERNKHERDEFARLLPVELNKAYALYQNPEQATLHRQWKGCFDCDVEELCYAMSRGESTQGLMQTKYTTRTDDLDSNEGQDA